MFNPVLVQPIKVQVINLGNVRDGAPSESGQVTIRIKSPSRRIHYTIEIGWTGNPAFTTKVWSLYPNLRNPFQGGQLIRLQPVKSLATLPDGYEAESGVRDWEAVIALESDDTVTSQIFATITWEPSLVEMCEAERTYWASLCTAEAGSTFDIGGST